MKFIVTQDESAIKKLYDAQYVCLYEMPSGIHIFINKNNDKLTFDKTEKVVYTDKIFV